jgi:hypothetical protein
VSDGRVGALPVGLGMSVNDDAFSK